jgi:hypothetical protein
MKDVYAIYGSKVDGRERSRWVRGGVAFENRNGSLKRSPGRTAAQRSAPDSEP